MLQLSTKSTAQFLSNSCLKNGTQKQKFPIGKSRLSSLYTITSVTVCVQSGHPLHGYMCIVKHATVEQLGQWWSGWSNATARWDAVSSGWRRESCYGRCWTTPHTSQPTGIRSGLLGGHSNSDFVVICNVCARKAVIKVAKRIFNSDKICRSYCDFYSGVTFFLTQCTCTHNS